MKEEIAILEVMIGDQWVEWKRIIKPADSRWSLALYSLTPQTRVRFGTEPDAPVVAADAKGPTL
jgi:hypothetical protein